MDLKNSTIAVASDTGEEVSSHFGRAPLYVVLTVVNGTVNKREVREKFAPHGAAGHEHGPDGHAAHSARHSAMLDSIRDCGVVIARGMGDGAYVHMTEAGMTVLLTGLHTVDEVAEAVQKGALDHDDRRLHHHGHGHGHGA